MAANYNARMQSRWNDSEAACRGGELALRAYTSRLLGADATLVMHGGGNTSLKTGEGAVDLLYVKSTGSDLATVDESAFTPLRLDGVRAVLANDCADNAAMMRALDACIARRPAPRPSIETLMHASLPFRFVEHTHADSVLAALNVEAVDTVHARIYGDVAPLVPYHHSGHGLARACMEIFAARRTPRTVGLILAFHGVVAFGDDARESYENMIRLVTMAEDYLKARGAWDVPPRRAAAASPDNAALEDVHGEINAVAGASLAMQVVTATRCLAFAQRPDLAEISQQGPATPQHAVYTKRVPMLGRDVRAFATQYRDYLDMHLGKAASVMIDAAPRIMLDPAFGMVAFGTTARAAEIAAAMYQHDIAIITCANAHGRYRSAPPAEIAQAEFEYGGHAQSTAPARDYK